jgi:tetratricopeptide (TPR) repeat protein
MSWMRAAVCALALALVVPTAAPAQTPASVRAWNALRDGQHEDAAGAFALAIGATPNDPNLHFGAGLAEFLLGRPTVAQHSLQRALELAPQFTAASLLLGEILYRGSDLETALRVFEAALEHAPDDKRLTARIDTLRREAALHRDFFQSQGSHFTVLFEGPSDEALARRAIDILEAAYFRVGAALSTFPDRVVTVVLYTREQFRDITRSPQWAAGSYDGRIRIPVQGVDSDSQELERVLTHEFTHALVQSIAPRGVPTWLNEGLAVLFEPTGEAWTDTQLAGPGPRLPLERLTGSFERLSRDEARLAYAQSAGLVRAMLNQGGPSAVVAILQDLAAGESFASALERRMFIPYDTFVADLQKPVQLLR